MQNILNRWELSELHYQSGWLFSCVVVEEGSCVEALEHSDHARHNALYIKK